MTQPARLHLFQAYGIELEYMIVDRTSLAVRPITDELLKKVAGEYVGDYENGIVTWSNELVLHVIELKSTRPEANFNELANAFQTNITRINEQLAGWNAMLMPSAAHPLMDPMTETRLWPHDNGEVYHIYDLIFNCKGHGWSNLQSTHLNLPFYDDEEFARLHAAIRIVLPLLPALCASSPILDGRFTGFLDTRLEFYRTNQQKIPSITGKMIPEAVFSKRQYLNTIYEKIREDIRPYHDGETLDPVWVNSRAAIPRFDRGSIEIRIMDIQECPVADLAIQTLVIETLKALTEEKFCSLDAQMSMRTEVLATMLEQTGKTGPSTQFDQSEYLKLFGLSGRMTTSEIWKHISKELLAYQSSPLHPWKPEVEVILEEGPLASRILKSTDHTSPNSIRATYSKLAECLAQGRMFIP